MVTYALEYRTGSRESWVRVGSPMMRVSDAVNTAAVLILGPEAETRILGLSTELQPDGTITRRELSPEELAAAICVEKEPPKPVKDVVFASDFDGREAIYVDGQLYRQMSLGEDDDLGVIDCVDAAGGSLVKLEVRWIQREVAAWPKRLSDLRLDG